MASDDLERRNMFVSRALEKISQLCASQKKWSMVKESCQYVMEYLKKDTQGSPAAVMSLCFVPLRLAAESKASKMIELSLDCLQKLMEYSFISGDMRWVTPKLDGNAKWMEAPKTWGQTEKEHEKQFIHHVVVVICANSSFTHDGVQLQIIKALLTAVSTPACGVHGSTLVMAVRNTYNIYLVSYNITNQTAKAALNHMINIVYQRMESSGVAEVSNASIATSVSEKEEDIVPPSVWLHELVEVMVDNSMNEQEFDFDRALAERIAIKIKKSDSSQSISRSSSIAPGTPGLGEKMIAETDIDTEKMVFQNHLHRDAFLLFWNFCKLSDKSLPDSASEEALEMKSKMLSLELLLTILSKAGPVFRTSERFLQAVKKKLCLSLLQNCVSPHLPVFRISLKLFLALITNFKDHLKREIGVFFKNVFFAILDSANSTYQQKMLVVQVIYKICENPQTILDVFINYDCDMDSDINIFEVMTNHLSRMLQPRNPGTHVESVKQDQDMRLLALKALVMILRSIVEWTEKFEAEVVTNGGTESQHPNNDDVENPDAADHESQSGSVSNVETDIEKARAHKKEVQAYVKLFNKSAKKGVQAFWDAEILEKEPLSVAKFLLEQPGLSKDAIGEYLGVLREFQQSVLSDFVETFDFSGMHIDEAVRLFLSKFRIQGEAEVIDATMEKFAECYTRANQSTFPNADTVYVLSFSIIMLHTDAHSTRIEKKDKMNKEGFIQNNRSIDSGKDLPSSFLSDIYDRVTAREFTLEGEEPASSQTKEAAMKSKKTGVFDSMADVFSSDGKKRMLNYAEESRAILEKSKALISGTKGQSFMKASKLEHAKPMFESAWTAMLPAFSVILEQCDTDQQSITDLCLEGFTKGIHISCIFYLDTERDAFVSALCKLTFLNNYREIEEKNIKSIKAVIEIASTEGAYLRSSWFAALKCFSQLERLQLLGSGAKPDFAFLNENSGAKHHKRATPQEAKLDTEKEKIRHFEQVNSLLIANHIDEVQISRIYNSTVDLSSEAIVFFVKHLCEVSAEEIEQSNPPRMFSLQKLIEIADVNMSRIRYVWGQLWSHMAKHFVRVGTNPQLSVSMFGIDSLRQLSTKFLEKRELTNYHFQRDFLKPFETIFQESRSIEIRELIVRCISQIVHGKADNVKSGWKTIFAVLALAAADKDEQIVVLAFEAVNHVTTNLSSLVVGADAFVDAVNCLTSFTCNTLSPSTAHQSVKYLQRYADEVGSELDTEIKEADMESPEDRAQLRVWFPVLGLSTGASQHPDLNVRLASLSTLFEVLKTHGSKFTPGMWKIMLSGAVFPIFDNALCDLALSIVIQEQSDPADVEKNTSVIQAGLTFLVDLFATFYPTLRQLLGEVLNIVLSCLKKPVPLNIVSQGMTAFIDLLSDHCDITAIEGGRGAVHGVEEGKTFRGMEKEVLESDFFTAPEWSVVTAKLVGVFEAKMLGKREATAEEIKKIDDVTTRREPIPSATVQSHYRALLDLLDMQSRLIKTLAVQWDKDTVLAMLSCLEMTHTSPLLPEGQPSGLEQPLANKCEEKALNHHLDCLSALYATQHAELVLPIMLRLVSDVIIRPAPRWQWIVIKAISCLVELPSEVFSDMLPSYYPRMLELINSPSEHVREATKKFFEKVGGFAMKA